MPPKYTLNKPPVVKIFKIDKNVLRFIAKNLNLSRDYYGIVYHSDKIFFASLNNGDYTTSANTPINEAILKEIRLFNSMCELRILQNPDGKFMGRYIFDGSNHGLTDSIRKFDEYDYLYDEFYEFSGETNVRMFNTQSTSKQRIHKGIVGGQITIPFVNLRYLCVRNYIEAVDDRGLKFTDSRLTGLYNRDKTLVAFPELIKTLPAISFI